MKVEVIKTFKDKETSELRKVGDKFTCTKKRYNEILSVGEFVKEVKEEQPEE